MGINSGQFKEQYESETLAESFQISSENNLDSFTIYEAIICRLMEDIEANQNHYGELTVLIYQIYMKVVFDRLLTMGYFSNQMLLSGVDSILINFGKILEKATSLPILGLQNETQTQEEEGIMDFIEDFQELKQKLQNFFEIVREQIPENKFNASIHLIGLAMTNLQFYNCTCDELLKGCYVWLSNHFSMNIPVTQFFEDEVKDYSLVFGQLVEEFILI